MAANDTKWIAVDWGTTHLRAWVFGSREEPIASLKSEEGMGRLNPGAFNAAVIRLIDPHLPEGGRIPVLCCGMVGARQGWVEAPYRTVPCPPLGGSFKEPEDCDPRIDVFIVPGLSQKRPPDVMRGEETQIAGLLHENPEFEGVVCLPGTHSKWCQIRAGKVIRFQTYLTGELFSLLCTQSILRHSVNQDDWFNGGFTEGVQDSVEDPAGFGRELFALRAGDFLADSSASARSARLSGLVIGLELAGARAFWESGPVTIVGAERISWAYSAAMSGQGVKTEVLDPEATTLAGLRAAYRQLQGTAV
ncbi:2-dehydro-3-deoxygalactonokinase [Notoacmeibacter sp. MSK16QG-6]|uniref:2-dehydro-3-deoxygalactonokinase n=1 Tax=Notoacmeibacter sp. MSK16QG-6 TaxID=2957982 RepID=UPI00209F56C6|nr:2-dehydro-3-deoxygalactonokinase [Notoacmeibacter sp. MSK16QG-6]MCP1201057.1 2-dehydro-3-deoxygalactonokinase [Notoacmeibacter sp. MSK16QG-6]